MLGLSKQADRGTVRSARFTIPALAYRRIRALPVEIISCHEWAELMHPPHARARVIECAPTYDVRGVDAIIEAGKAQNGPFAEIRQEQRLIAETDDTVVSEWTWSVPHPDGGDRWFILHGLSYFVFQDGRVAKIRQYFDVAGFLAVFSPPTAAPRE